MEILGTAPLMAELRRLLGDMDDARFAAILNLEPSMEDIEEALAWAEGRADTIGNGPWPLSGKAGAIFEILTADEEESPPQ